MYKSFFKNMFFLHNNLCKKVFVFSTLVGITLGSIGIISISLKQSLVDEVLNLNKKGGGLRKAVIYLIILGIIFAIRYIVDNILYYVYNKSNVSLKRDFNEKILNKTYRLSYELIEKVEIQDLLKKMENPSERIISIFDKYKSLIKSVIQITGTMIIVSKDSIWLIIPICLFILIGIVVSYKTANVTYGYWEKYIENSRKYNYISSIMINREYALEKKLFGYTSKMNDKFEKEFEDARVKNKGMGKLRLKNQCIMDAFSIIYTVFSFIILIPSLLNGKISIGFYFATSNAISDIFNIINEQLNNVIDFKEHMLYVKDLNYFFKLEEKVELKEEFINKNMCFHKIVFKNVYFAYQNENKYVLEDFNLTIEKGVNYALVGENGAGKSTIIKLLLGLYKPQKGSIFIDTKDITKMSQNEINQYFSVIFQDFCRYPFTLKENIIISNINEKENISKINEVIREVGIKEKIDTLPNKLETNMLKLKDDGIDLSGGEWQKIAITRMLFANKPICILDEPTASLDPLAEANMYNMYDKCLKLKNLTSIFVSHRLGPTKLCNTILVLHKGKIEELGSYEELMNAKGIYYSMFMKQRSLYE